VLPYSTRFVELTRERDNVFYTCPAGKRAIVVSIDWVNFATTAIRVNGWIGAVCFFMAELAAGPSHVHWEGRQVFYAGEQLQLNGDLAGIEAMASGYLLDDLG